METKTPNGTAVGLGIVMLRQEELTKYHKLEESIDRRKKALKEDEKELAGLAQNFTALLNAGIQVEEGVLIARLEIKEGSRRVEWKEQLIEYVDKREGPGKGAKLAERILEKTEKPTKTELVVEAR